MGDAKLISLKEASTISGYTPDYIGQLIRAGKIRGEKVYCQISWMTTAEEVLNYKSNNKQNNPQNLGIALNFSAYFNRLASELKFVKVFFQNIKSLIPFILILFVCIIVLIFFTLDLVFNNNRSALNCADQANQANGLEY